MNEKYLWDKTGEDAGIEKLEQALQMFRHRENSPPALPAKLIPFELRRRPHSFFRFATAFAACALLVAIGLAVWLNASKTGPSEAFVAGQINAERAQNITAQPAPPAAPIITAPALPPIVKAKAPAAGKVYVPAYAFERKPVKKPEFIRPNNLTAAATTIHNPAPEKKPVRLTREERFAYDQLMLALSITSSKLKIVKDTAEGANQPKSAFSDRE